MTIIDSPGPLPMRRTLRSDPWHSVPNWPDHVTGDEDGCVGRWDKVGRSTGAIFISAFSMYRLRPPSYGRGSATGPSRAGFAIVKPVDPDDPAVGRCRRRTWEEDVGHGREIRIMLTMEAKARGPTTRGLDRILRARAVRHDFSGQHPVLGQLWTRGHCAHPIAHPDARFIIDHSGHPCKPRVPARAAGRPLDRPPERRWKLAQGARTR